jgi:uncharacterized protein (UPF0210 family)
MTRSEELLINAIPQAMALTEHLCASVNIGSTRTGINMDAVKADGCKSSRKPQKKRRNQDSIGCSKLVVLCNAPDDNPFMAGAFHGVTESDAVINVGVSGPGVIKQALQCVKGKDFTTCAKRSNGRRSK